MSRRALDVPRLLTAFVRRLLRTFFLRIEVEGLENVPAEGGGVIVAWHPNGLLDPGLIHAHFPRRVVFGARHGLFSWPLLGSLLRALDTVPIYRPQDSKLDESARRETNRRSLDALAQAVVDGSYAALFPEGVSHDAPHLEVLRPGAARLFLRAHELAPDGAPGPWLVPVALHYDRKHLFGSKVLVEIHPPMAVPKELLQPAADEDEDRRQVGDLTGLIETTLTDVIHATDSWELHHWMHRLRKAIRAERAARAHARPGPPTVRERILGFARIRLGYLTRRQTHPQQVEILERRVERYDTELRALGLDDHELGHRADLGSPGDGILLVIQALAVYLVLPPLLILGYLVNVPVALGLGWAARRLGAKRKDVATLKLLLGAVAFPAIWLVMALLVAWGTLNIHDAYPQIPEAPVWAGVVTFLLCSVGGVLGLRYLRLAKSTYRSLRVRLTRARRRRAVERLRDERAALFEATMELAADLELPGTVESDGRIRSSVVEA